MKLYPKNQLHLEQGLFIDHSGDVVVVDANIALRANELETKLQEARYLAAQPKANPAPTLDGFKREHMDEIAPFTAETPIADKKIEEAMAFMDEMDSLNLVDDMNRLMDHMRDLVLFARNDAVISINNPYGFARFDTPLLGDPLTWTEETIANAVAEICGCIVEKVTRDDGESE